jgi:hypothetical protein
MLRFRLFTTAFVGTAIAGGAMFSALTISPAQAATKAPATSSASLTCKASMSNAKPKDDTKVYVDVTTKAAAKVTTAAHFKSKTDTYTATASSSGKASIYYYVDGATPGYKVTVDVKVKKGSSSGSCKTSFTPVK